jgi:integrase/recombinase XerD
MRQPKDKIALEDFLSRKYTSETVKSYQYIIERFLEQYPNANRLELSAIESYMVTLKKHNHSIGYRRVALSAIKAYYEAQVENKRIKHHPCKALFLSEKSPKGKNFSAMLSMEEMEMLFKVLPTRYQCTKNRNKAIVGLLIYQGLVSQELVELKLNHLDLEQGTIRVPRSCKNRTRTLALKSNQITPLMNYIENERSKYSSASNSPLFLSMRGMKMTTDSLHALIDGMQGAFDKNISPKQIRQSVINYWLNVRKLPLEDVQVMAGHRYPSSTEKYIQKDIQGQREALSSLHSEIFGEGI